MNQQQAEAAAEETKIGVALAEFRKMQTGYAEQIQRDKVNTQPRIVRRFYEAVTRFYEFGWGTSFHFAPRTRGEKLAAAQRRQQEEIVRLLNLEAGMVAGDVGCGIGGPMMSIARMSGASIVGINISDHQIRRGNTLVKNAGLEDRCEFLHANFLDLPCADDHLDAVYSIEAVCHSPDRLQAFREIFRTLKPGGKFVIFDWVLTDLYEDANARHQDVRKRFEYGNATPNLFTAQEQIECIRSAGFEILYAADHALTSDPETPWYMSLEGRDFSFSSLARIPAGRFFTANFTKLLELLRIAPQGTSETANLLNMAADALVEAGQLGIFTPCFLVHARKPEGA
ncbi:MAG: methyltransferase domain-containing protein [Gammaproteobacteria bacterium]|nr:methyltransferase domain-containing protein [Gammaproteobacteria bacterium]MYG96024.1 methyltransferase domain-containing protein [Gammaproteobacteria bacterium]